MTDHTDVVVIGGGYAGVLAADRLTLGDDLTVTLVNPRPSFVERIRLHQLVGGSDDAVVEYRDVLRSGIRLIVDTATRIDAAARTVELASGGTLPYDHLVYAAGSGSADPSVPGAAEFAHPIASFEEAQRLRQVLAAAPAPAPVTVVGAGPTGIETAAELAEQGRAVTLVSGDVLGPYLHARVRRVVAKRLAQLGVTVLEGPGARVVAITSDAVRLADGREVATAIAVWTAGFRVPELARRSGLRTDALGRIITDETLTSVDSERVVAAGDSASPSGMPFRMSCQAAVQLGPHAAETVLRRIAGEPPAPLALAFAGQCISLGRRGGVMQLSGRDDTAGPLHIGGRAGALLKEFVCRGTVQQLVIEARWPGRLRFPAWAMDRSRGRLVQSRLDGAQAAEWAA